MGTLAEENGDGLYVEDELEIGFKTRRRDEIMKKRVRYSL